MSQRRAMAARCFKATAHRSEDWCALEAGQRGQGQVPLAAHRRTRNSALMEPSVTPVPRAPGCPARQSGPSCGPATALGVITAAYHGQRARRQQSAPPAWMAGSPSTGPGTLAQTVRAVQYNGVSTTAASLRTTGKPPHDQELPSHPRKQVPNAMKVAPVSDNPAGQPV
jgi:hypothetical protein